MAGAIAGTAILRSPKRVDSLHTVTLTINNLCNYHCPHCYMQYEGPDMLLSQDALSFIFQSNFKHLAIVGREPLLDRKAIDVCEQLIRQANKKSISISIITNGANLNYINDESLSKLTYIDVSFDGGPKTYDQYRKGTFEAIIRNIKLLNSRGFDRFNALHTINSFTIENIDDMMKISDFADFQNIMFSPYIKTESYRTNEEQLVPLEKIFCKLSQCKDFIESQNAFILLDVYHIENQGVNRAELGELISNSGIAMKIKFIPEDPLLHGFLRVTYDGHVLTPYDSLHTLRYKTSQYKLFNNSLESIYKSMLNDYISCHSKEDTGI